MQKEKLHIALIQFDIQWQNPIKNRAILDEKIVGISPVDLIVLPEMFTTGFISNPKALAEEMNGSTVQWMQQIAKKKQCAITGSIVIKEANCFYNRLLFVYPDGELSYYDKRHLFSFAKEDEQFTAGVKPLIVEYKSWRICPFICYDLRFPVWSRNTQGYDMLLYIANWPKPRLKAWNTLLEARAIENLSFVIGVNRVGVDGVGLNYLGSSRIIGPLGDLLAVDNATSKEQLIEFVLDKNKLKETRIQFPFLDDKDSFNFSK